MINITKRLLKLSTSNSVQHCLWQWFQSILVSNFSSLVAKILKSVCYLAKGGQMELNYEKIKLEDLVILWKGQCHENFVLTETVGFYARPYR